MLGRLRDDANGNEAHLIKKIAILLLVWAAIDLCVPGFCQTDGIAFSSAPAHFEVVSKKAPARGTSRTLYEDDCFCCCSHIVHRPYFVLEVSLPTTSVNLQHFFHEPYAIAMTHFHPPRA